MPKDVDHDARRAEVARSVWRVVAEEGLERATFRRIADETGWSVGALSHYYVDKEGLLQHALQIAYENIDARWDRMLEGTTGIEALRVLLLDNLPLDPQRLLETKFLMNYWSREIRGEFRTESETPRPAARSGRSLLSLLITYIEQAQRAGEITSERDPEEIAEVLLGLIDGFSLHALLDPTRLTNERQIALIEAQLSELRRREGANGTRTVPTNPTPRSTHA